MSKTRKCLMVCVLAGMMAMISTTSFGAPIVSYSVSGSSGNWTLDFSVTNTLGGHNGIYIFGVLLPEHNITGVPENWYENYISYTWNNKDLGGFDIDYNNIWGSNRNDVDAIFNGQTLSGFEALVTTDLAPTSVPWYVFAIFYNATSGNNVYMGSDAFSGNMLPPGFVGLANPGFEGSAHNSSSVPEPTTMLLLGLGLMGLAGVRRKFKK
jgi:hypothetical protein